MYIYISDNTFMKVRPKRKQKVSSFPISSYSYDECMEAW